MDDPLSQSGVSLQLSLIQKQCEKLLEEGQTDLSLEEPVEPASSGGDGFNPYDDGK